jgi:hypothetical protein
VSAWLSVNSEFFKLCAIGTALYSFFLMTSTFLKTYVNYNGWVLVLIALQENTLCLHLGRSEQNSSPE